MGIFSDKKTYVGTSVLRVIEDTHIPKIEQNAVIESVLKNQNVTDTLIETLINDATLRYDQAYSYAEKGDYFYGLPNTHILTDFDGAALVQSTLDALEGEPVSIVYREFAPLNHIHMAWQELYNNLGYNPVSNEITGLSSTEGFTVYLEKIVPVYQTDGGSVSPGAWNDWNPNSLNGVTPLRVNVVNSELRPTPKVGESEVDSVEIHSIWVDNNQTIQRSITILDLSSYESEQEYYQVKYTTTQGTRYWTYLAGEGTYTLLDDVYDTEVDEGGTYFPFIMFRSNDTNRAAEEYRDTDEFKTTERILNYLGMDFVTVSDELHNNPDIDSVDQAVMMMGVPVNSINQHDLRYLYDFFDRLEIQIPDEVELLDRASITHDPANPHTYNADGRRVQQAAPKASLAIVFQDADFKMTLSLGGVIRSTKSGTLGKIGTYVSTTTTTEYTTSYYNTSESRTDTLAVSEGVNLVYRKQVSENLYEELIVIDPSVRYSVKGRYGTIGGAQSEIFLIPLDKSITEHYGQLFNSQLYPRSLHFVFNSRVVQKLKWYETGFFKFVLIVATVALTIVTGGAASFTVGLAAAAAAGITALAFYLLKIIVLHFLFRYLFRITVKELGMETAFIIAIMAAVIGAYDASTLPPGGDTFWAENFLTVSSGLTQGISDVAEELYKDLLSDYSDFNTEKELRLGQLEEAQDLLDDSPTFSPFIIFGEKPEDYFNRTIHAGNIGTRGFDYIESYVEVSLRLPDVNDSLGDNYA